MKLLKAFALAAFSFAIASCDKGPTPADEIGYGSMENGVYSNEYMGLEISVPETWVVHSREQYKAISSQGAKQLAGNDKAMDKMLNAAEQQTVNLLAASKHPVGAPVPDNPNISILAESVKAFPGIASGKDYFYHTKKMLDMAQVDYVVVKEGHTRDIGGKPFDVMELDMKVMGRTIHQKQYARKVKDYILLMATTYLEEEQPLLDMLDTAKLKY